MSQAAPTVSPDPMNLDRLPSRVARVTFMLGVGYALILAILERILPIKPNWVALEVIGGVLLVGLPVMLIARTSTADMLTWRDYERMVIAGFIGAGLPICIWQTITYLVLPLLHLG